MAENWQTILEELKQDRNRSHWNHSEENLELIARFVSVIQIGSDHPMCRPLMELIEKSRPEYERR